MAAKINLNIRETLRFFDEVTDENRKLATGMVAISGEDLGAGIFKEFLRREKNHNTVKIYPNPVTPGTQQGSRLDRWIETDTVLYQAEIKNWSAHAIRGKILKYDASMADVQKNAEWHWQDEWDFIKKRPKKASVAKVLNKMDPRGIGNSKPIIPLVIYWFPIRYAISPFFAEPASSDNFKELWFFSMSSFLRQLLADGVPAIDIEMPNYARLLEFQTKMFK